jgi:predicted RND superfamily exporter protein
MNENKSVNPLTRFRDFLILCFDISYRNHRTTLVLSLAIFIGIMGFFKPLDVHVTVDDLINKEDETSKDYFRLKNDFNVHTNAFILFQKSSNFTQEELCQLKKWVILTGLEIPNIQETYSPLFLRESKLDKSSQGFQRLSFPLIIDLTCDEIGGPVDALAKLDGTPWMGLLVGKDHHDFAHEYQIGHLNEKNFVIEKMVPLMERLQKSAEVLPKSVKVHWLGDASYQAEMAKGIIYNNILNIFIVIFVLIAFRVFFGTWVSGLLYVSTLVYSCLIIFGLMSLTGTPMDVLNSSLFLFLAVSSIGDFIFLSQHELDKGSEGRQWKETFRELITPCFFTSFTTFIGFISLCVSEVELVARLGFWVAMSGAIEWVTTLLVLPCLMKLLLKDKPWVNSRKSFSLSSLSFLDRIRFPKTVCYVLLSVFLIAPFCFSKMNISDSPMELFKSGNPFRESVNYLFETRGFSGDVSVVFQDESRETFNREVLKKISADSNVSKIENPYEILDFYTNKLGVEQAKLMRKTLKETSQFKRFFANEKTRAIIYLKDAELSKLYEMRKRVKNEFCRQGECMVSGILIAYADFSQNVSQTLLSSFSLSFCLVILTVLFLTYYTHNFRYIFPLLMSSLWGGAMVVAALAILQIKINFVTSLVVAIMVGMNGDNTIQFILSGMDKGIHEGVKERAVGSMLTTLLLIVSSMVFLFHYFEPPVTFGLLLMFGFLMSLIGDLWILKGLLPEKKS